MTDHEEPDLPQDAPLRMRVWWRFWRGWRWMMLGVVVLVGAWSTRPGVAQHTAAKVVWTHERTNPAHRLRIIDALYAYRPRPAEVLSVERFREVLIGGAAGAPRQMHPIDPEGGDVFVDAWLWTYSEEPCFLDESMRCSIGFLGMVWVLD